jgi:hypothetical protein
MVKVICEKCESSFKYETVKDMKCCPVCGEAFESISSDVEEPDIVDFESPDLYFYDIEDEEDEEDEELREVWCQCTSCRAVNTILCNQFSVIKSKYVKLKDGIEIYCKGCGKQFTNPIVPKRPDGWRELNRWEIDLKNIPKCPICSSTKVHKISMTNKAASIVTFGIFAAGHVSKTYKCDICGSKF